MSTTQFTPLIEELRGLEKKLTAPRCRTPEAILGYIDGRLQEVEDASARQELKLLAGSLREHRSLDFALGDVHEALSAIAACASGIDERRHG